MVIVSRSSRLDARVGSDACRPVLSGRSLVGHGGVNKTVHSSVLGLFSMYYALYSLPVQPGWRWASKTPLKTTLQCRDTFLSHFQDLSTVGVVTRLSFRFDAV